jgi:hypothetical protein
MQIKVADLVEVVIRSLSTYRAPGGNFDGRETDVFACVTSAQRPTFVAEITQAFGAALVEAESHVTVGDLLLALEDKIGEKVRRDVARAAIEAELEKTAAEKLAGLTPEDKEAMLRLLSRATVAP